jgi:TIR domain
LANIFLSYAQEDRARVNIIADLLTSCGWSVFWDSNIKAGTNWREVLQAELDASGAVVVLWSRFSVASTWVHEEAERGRARLISVRIDDVELPLGFSRLQGVDLIGWRGGKADGVGKLVDAVSETLRMPAPQPPKVPRSPSQNARIAIAAGLAGILLAAYPAIQWLRQPAPIMNQEIVIDTSEGMSARFDNGPTKLEAAVEALRNRNLHPAENLAFRQFGGECHKDDDTRLLVSFGTNRRDRIVKATKGLRPRGQPALASAVISALADMQPLSNAKRVVVLTGHTDKCEQEALREIKERVEAYKQAGHELSIEMRFIGLAVPAEDQERIRAISDAVGGESHFVSTVAELNDVLQYVLEFEPAVTHVKAVWDVVGKVGQSLNDVANNTNEKKFDEADKILEAGQASYLAMRPSFDALAGRQVSPQFERFYTLAAQNLSLEQQVFDVGRKGIRLGRAAGKEPTPEYEKSIEEWNALVAKCNANINEMNRLTEEIIKEARKRG